MWRKGRSSTAMYNCMTHGLQVRDYCISCLRGDVAGPPEPEPDKRYEHFLAKRLRAIADALEIDATVTSFQTTFNPNRPHAERTVHVELRQRSSTERYTVRLAP